MICLYDNQSDVDHSQNNSVKASMQLLQKHQYIVQVFHVRSGQVTDDKSTAQKVDLRSIHTCDCLEVAIV